MDRFDRLFKLHNLLATRKTPISMADLRRELRCSRATVARDIEALRDYLGAPISYEHERKGYRYDPEHGAHPYELPGLWFSAEELHGLLICQQLLTNIGPGLLSAQIAHMQKRIEKLLARHPHDAQPDFGRVKILSLGNRRLSDHGHFLRAATALFGGKRLAISYRARSDDHRTEREISPQSLLFYRDNWYLDAWCHWRDELRIFAIDRIDNAEVLEREATRLPEDQLRAYFASAYGIFSGAAQHTAVLVFSAERARWVADEHWHPEQQSRWLEDGRYQLQIPFNDHRELLMDILKYGADVEVQAPEFLVAAVVAQVVAMRDMYRRE